MAKYYHTHIWDITEYNWYLNHPDTLFTVPACGEYFNATRDRRTPLLVMIEAMLPRGTSKEVACHVCDYLNLQIRQGTQEPDFWEDLAEGPQ